MEKIGTTYDKKEKMKAFPKREPMKNENHCPYNGVAYSQVPGYDPGYGCPICKGIGLRHLPIPIADGSKYITGSEKIDDEHIELEYNDSSKEVVLVIRIKSRNSSLKLLKKYTEKALRQTDAIETFDKLFSPSVYFKLRNYEIEDELDRISGGYFRIDELCPFNGFSWYSGLNKSRPPVKSRQQGG